MLLTETGGIPPEALPVAAFRAHLRLGTGLADETLQDGLLESHLRAALAVIEGRTGKVLLARDFLLRLGHWRGTGVEQALPVAPVTAVASVTVIDAEGTATVVDPGRWRLIRDLHRPRIAAKACGFLPDLPTGGAAEIAFTAGFAPDWAGQPADLAQAVFLLAAQYHEARHEGGAEEGAMSFGVQALIERWRTVRLLAGREGA
ncbi:head-tail connector protein [Frigidibacter sp. MR17.24]|uniref:head-tail connector protein n=1 Tax=Frigidibacter sp. MR17.24 TaxID=3127345 RepID=UPI0030131AC5